MKIFWKRKIADQKDSILDKILEKYNFQTENILGKVRQKQESDEFDMRTCIHSLFIKFNLRRQHYHHLTSFSLTK